MVFPKTEDDSRNVLRARGKQFPDVTIMDCFPSPDAVSYTVLMRMGAGIWVIAALLSMFFL